MTEAQKKTTPGGFNVKGSAFGVYDHNGNKVPEIEIKIIESLQEIASAKRRLEGLLRTLGRA
ncbi:MAG: hypothetical protein WC637_00280 [Victivallales bacterium]|jgi:hypothetical protein